MPVESAFPRPESLDRSLPAGIDVPDVAFSRGSALADGGRRRVDVRAPAVDLALGRRAEVAASVPCAILRMVVRNATPAVRPGEVLAGLREVAALTRGSSPVVTRLARGPLDAVTGGLAGPLGSDRESGVVADERPRTTRVEDEDVVGA